MVKISLDIPEDIHDQLNKLSETYSQDFEETVNEVLYAVCINIRWLVESNKVETIARRLRTKISWLLNSGKMADRCLFENILKELNAEGHFVADDMEIDLDENSIWILYEGLEGSNLFVDSFDVTLTGLKQLTADCIVYFDEEDDETQFEIQCETQERIEEHARRIERASEELPEEFHDLDQWETFVIGEDTSICLRAHFCEESLGYLPSIPAISEFFEKILASAGVSKPLY